MPVWYILLLCYLENNKNWKWKKKHLTENQIIFCHKNNILGKPNQSLYIFKSLIWWKDTTIVLTLRIGLGTLLNRNGSKHMF